VTARALSSAVACAVVLTTVLTAGGSLGAQASPPPALPSPKAVAPIDLTGTWVSIITEDWRYRMVMPARGDYASVPTTPEAVRVADAWDPDKDEAAGEACKAYGAAGLMRLPGRLRISWQDDQTLKVDTDAGMQTRLLHFNVKQAPAGTPATWQGFSIATWEGSRAMAAARGAATRPAFGNLKVVTTHLKAGYLRKNGVPYSENAVLTEFWDLHKEANGDQWIVLTTYVDDPKYLQQLFLTSPNFLREPDGSKWDPTPCSAKW